MPDTWIMNAIVMLAGMSVGSAVVMLNLHRYFYFSLLALIGLALPMLGAIWLDSIVIFGL